MRVAVWTVLFSVVIATSISLGACAVHVLLFFLDWLLGGRVVESDEIRRLVAGFVGGGSTFLLCSRWFLKRYGFWDDFPRARISKPTTPPLAGRKAMADCLFAESLSIDERNYNLALSIRRAVAKVCQVEAQLLYPTDPTLLLAEQAATHNTWQDWDDIYIVFALEDELERELLVEVAAALPRFLQWRLFWLKGSSPANFGEWVEKAVAVLDRES